MEHHCEVECPYCGEDVEITAYVPDEMFDDGPVVKTRYEIMRIGLAWLNATTQVFSAVCTDLIGVLQERAVRMPVTPSPNIEQEAPAASDRKRGGITVYDS